MVFKTLLLKIFPWTKGIRYFTLRRLWVACHRLPTISLEQIGAAGIEVEPAIKEDICMPPYYNFTDHDDYAPLIKIAKFIQPETILELGTAYGNTVANLCRQLPEVQVVTVNAPVEVQTGQVTTFDLTVDEIGRVYRQHGFSDRVTQIFENTLNLDLSLCFDEPCVDLAIIDACHDTNFVINDFHKVRPFIRSGGMVLLHDTHPSIKGHLEGSYKACVALRKEGFDIRHLKGTWWGIWRNGNQKGRNPLMETREIKRSSYPVVP